MAEVLFDQLWPNLFRFATTNSNQLNVTFRMSCHYLPHHVSTTLIVMPRTYSDEEETQSGISAQWWGSRCQISNKNTNDPPKGLYYKGMYSVRSVKFLCPGTHLVCTCLVGGSFVFLFGIWQDVYLEIWRKWTTGLLDGWTDSTPEIHSRIEGLSAGR